MTDLTFTRLLTDSGLHHWDLKGPAGLVRFVTADALGIKTASVYLHGTVAPGGAELEDCDVCGRCWPDAMGGDHAKALREDWEAAAYHDAVIRTQLEKWYTENLAAWAAEQAPEDQDDDQPAQAEDQVTAIVDLIKQYGNKRHAVVAASARDGSRAVSYMNDADDLLDRIRRTLADADQVVPAKDLPMLLAKHAPELPYIALARLAAALDEAGYRIVRATTPEGLTVTQQWGARIRPGLRVRFRDTEEQARALASAWNSELVVRDGYDGTSEWRVVADYSTPKGA